MKKLLWVVLVVGMSAIIVWGVTNLEPPISWGGGSMILIILAVNSLGMFGMLYVTIRHETRPLLFVLLAFIPYAFIWYFFDRVRKMRILTIIPFAKGRYKFPIFGYLLAILIFDVLFLSGINVKNPTEIAALLIVMTPLMIIQVGILWMMYTAIRHEEHPWVYVMVAVIPFAFVWYYFARIKQGKAKRNHALGGDPN